MIELGLYSFISALIVCINQALTLMPSTSFKVHYRWLVYAQFGFAILSFFCLIWAHVTSDFSVSVVANNTHSLMSPTYKLASVWGQHQGSAFFWFVGISFVSFLFLIIEKQIPGRQMAIIQGVQSLILLLIGSYILIVANPFERSLPFPMEGNGLNPLLQDPGLTYHPPVLFSGHFFLTLLYSLAVTKPFKEGSYKGVVRRWTLISFAFLTLGISLGSFWAYYVLGWGGWWYWDPVEAVSLFPWLILLMSIHAQGAQKSTKQPRSFAAILNVLALLFSVLSTLIVRSGLLTSVHSFAIDGIGTIYLACVFLILLIVGLSRTLKKGSEAEGSPSTDQNERVMNLHLTCVCYALLVVLLGVLGPVIFKMMGGENFSLGPRYFSTLLLPVFFFWVILLLFYHFSLTQKKLVKKRAVVLFIIFLSFCLLLGLICGKAFTSLSLIELVLTVVMLFLGVGIALTSVILGLSKNGKSKNTRLSQFLSHFGLGIFIIGLTGAYSLEQESYADAVPGKPLFIHGDQYTIEELYKKPELNSLSTVASIKLKLALSGNHAIVFPERRYFYQNDAFFPISAMVFSRLILYNITLGEPNDDGSWQIRVKKSPLLLLVWLGGVFIFIGCIVGVIIKREEDRVYEKK